MARKWSAWTAGSALTGTEKFPGLDGSGDPNKTWLASQLATYILTQALAKAGGTMTGALTLSGDPSSALHAATKQYVDAAVTGLLDFKGSTDCSGNPNYPAASKGDAYVVSVAGKIGGASGTSVDIGDVYVASADNAGGTQAAVGTSWFVLEHNLAGALLAANNLSDLTNATTARANLGIVDPLAIPSGRYMLPEGVGQAGAAPAAPGIDSMRMHLGYVRHPITVSELLTRISSGAAAGNVQIAVYAPDPVTTAPTGAAVYSSPSQSTAVATTVGPTGLSLSLPAGWYWWMTNTDLATAVFGSKSNLNTDMGELVGSTTATNVLSASANMTGMVKAQTFGTWPTLSGNFATDSITPVTTQTIPLVAFKV